MQDEVKDMYIKYLEDYIIEITNICNSQELYNNFLIDKFLSGDG